MARVKIAILVLVVFTATALTTAHEMDSNHALDRYSSPAPSPSADGGEHKKISIICTLICALNCQGKKSWRKAICLGLCLVRCSLKPYDVSPEITCVAECAQIETNNLPYDTKMMNERMSTCTDQCKKD